MLNQEGRSWAPPLVRGWPVVGNAIPLVSDTLGFLRRAHEAYGDVYRIRIGRHEVLVMGGVDANRFLSENGKDCFTSTPFWGPTLREMDCPHSFSGVDGEPHQYQRALLMNHFAKSKFTPRVSQFAEIFRETLDAWRDRRALAAPLFRHVVSQQIGSAMQGYRPTSAEVEALVAYEYTALNVLSLKKLPRVMLRLPKYRAAKRQVRQLADKILALHGRESSPPTFLNAVLDEGRKRHPEWFTEGDVRSHAVTPFIAGADTVGTELCFAMLELFKQPALRQRLRNEVDDVFRHGVPDYATLERMTGLKNFCKEVLRLYPTIFALRRTATRDFDFKQYRVREGQDVMVFSTADHTSPAYFKDPYRFDIDRYEAPRSERAPLAALAPFGVGSHTCMAAGLANLLLTLNVALLLFYTDMTPAGDVGKIKPSYANPGMAVDARFAVNVVPRRGADVERPPSANAADEGAAGAAARPPAGATPGTGAAPAVRALRIVLRREACEGHGVCSGEAPELFRIGADGKVEAVVDVAEGPLALKAEQAAAGCPARVIRTAECP